MLDTKKQFLNAFPIALTNGTAAIFAGAGVSVESGCVDWKGLLRQSADELGLDIDKEVDLIAVAQYYVNECHQNRSSLNQKIIFMFSAMSKENSYMNALAKLPIKTYWTTNYDKVIENTLIANKIKVDVKIFEADLAANVPNADVTVYKFHGDVASPNSAVLIKDDYETFSRTHQLFITALQGDLVAKTFLYIGYSFNDPNLTQILAHTRMALGTNTKQHFCIIKRVQQKDYNDDIEYDYACRKEELVINDLKRYGIFAILVDDYNEIKQLLNTIYQSYITKSVFIAGSSRNYGDWSKSSARDFLYKLGYNLIQQDYFVSSGFVEGVGPMVVNGALTAINYYNKNLERFLRIKPLPLVDGKADDIEVQTKKMFQNDMIEKVGIVIFVFGNNYYDGELKSSNGAWHDYERALSYNRYIIPVGSTGFTALDVFNDMKKRELDYPYLSRFWDGLKQERDPDKLIKIIFDVIKSITDLLQCN